MIRWILVASSSGSKSAKKGSLLRIQGFPERDAVSFGVTHPRPESSPTPGAQLLLKERHGLREPQKMFIHINRLLLKMFYLFRYRAGISVYQRNQEPSKITVFYIQQHGLVLYSCPYAELGITSASIWNSAVQ
jgi:hypothetical protein